MRLRPVPRIYHHNRVARTRSKQDNRRKIAADCGRGTPPLTRRMKHRAQLHRADIELQRFQGDLEKRIGRIS